MKAIDNSQWPLNSILVSHKYRVLYTPVAKNANTTLKRLFVRLSGHPRSAEMARAGKVHVYLTSNRTGLSLCDYSPERATQILEDPDYFKFVVLREPLPRAVSGYLDKFVLNPPKPAADGEPPDVIGTAIDWVYEQRGEKSDYGRSITFEEFVAYITQQDDKCLDTHFKSQESYLAQQNFDFTGTLEQMEKLRIVLKSRFCQEVAFEHQNRIKIRKPLWRRRHQERLLPAHLRRQRTLPHASELLTEELETKLKSRYARDYQLWREASA